MARRRVDTEGQKALRRAKEEVEAIEKADANEATTRARVERILEWVCGYDPLRHLSREHAVHGAGETEHVDFALQLDDAEDAKPLVMVEIKRVGINLAPKHLKQVTSYAINAGSEWILLTNAREWRLYHVAFGQPPVTKLLFSWDLLGDDPAAVARGFRTISYASVSRGGLGRLWQKAAVLQPRNVLEAILSEDSVRVLRRELRKSTGVLLPLEDVVSGIRRLLNESAATEMEAIRISFPERKTHRRKRRAEKDEGSSDEKDEENTEGADQN
jgi:hypothetical protein